MYNSSLFSKIQDSQKILIDKTGDRHDCDSFLLIHFSKTLT